ncbi:hypothetical protein AB5J62_15215 [Amycolatopsis sp. cg5]|uniref:hypothetical protein n=1 Tax=Amycolatopsis sp. cg5 TaxID=3238802 RepID=UPI0035264FF9
MRGIMLDTGLEPAATLRELFHTQNRWHDVATYAALADRRRTAASEHELKLLHNTSMSNA